MTSVWLSRTDIPNNALHKTISENNTDFFKLKIDFLLAHITPIHYYLLIKIYV